MNVVQLKNDKRRSLYGKQTEAVFSYDTHEGRSAGRNFFKRTLLERYQGWTGEQKEEFLDFCSGNRGVKILYDSFFKEIMSPETAPERLEEFLTLLLGQNVKILRTLPNDSSRLADENSLVIMDIIVELEDHSIANVEVQKLGYMFPGQRSACYSADLLLRQYKRVRGEKGKAFSYKDIKKYIRSYCMRRAPGSFLTFRTTMSIIFLMYLTPGFRWICCRNMSL